MASSTDKKPPQEQEAEERARSRQPREARDAVADAPAATSDATEGKPKESDSDRTAPMTKEQWLPLAGQVFGAAPWTLAGALHDVEDDAVLSQSQVQARIDKVTDRGDRS